MMAMGWRRRMGPVLAVLGLLALAGCAARYELPEAAPDALAPGAPGWDGARAVMADGTALATARWGRADDPEAVFLALHGFNDYRCGYAVPAPDLVGERALLVSYDQRGFGDDAQAGLWPGNDRLVADAATMVALVRARYPKARLYLLGVSMGGAVALQVAADPATAPALDGVVLVAPAVWGWSTLNPFYALSLRLVALVAPGWSPTGEGLDRVPSDNRALLAAMGADARVIKATRMATVKGLVDTMDAGLKAADGVRVPWLAVYGGRDQIVPADPVARLERTLPADLGRLERFPDSYHMMLRDRGRAPVLRAIRSFAGLAPVAPSTPAAVADVGVCRAYEAAARPVEALADPVVAGDEARDGGAVGPALSGAGS